MKKKFEDFSSVSSGIYAECAIHVNEKDVSEWGYTFSLFGNYIIIDRNLSAEEVRQLIRCLTAALKATGEWKEEGGAR